MKVKLTPKSLIVLFAAAALLVPVASAQAVKHVATAEALNNATSKPQPEYSGMARQLKLQGPVEVNAFISEDGKVEKVESISGNPVLVKCAEDALKRWKFTPFTEDGKPVKAVAALSFTFKM